MRPGFFQPVDRPRHPKTVVLFDLQSEMLQIARDRVHAAPNATPFRVTGRVCRCGHVVDAVFIATVLGEIPDQGACFDEVRRILRPGGVLAVAETRRDSDFIAFPKLVTLLSAIRVRVSTQNAVSAGSMSRCSARNELLLAARWSVAFIDVRGRVGGCS